MLDNSISIGYDGFEKSKNFITNVAEYFNQDSTRVGVIEFNSESKIVVPFSLNRKTDELKLAVNGIKYQSGAGHSILKAFQTASSHFSIQELQGGKFVVLITSSEHSDIAQHSAAAISKSAMESRGIRFMVVAAGDKVNQDKLIDYSSGTQYVYKAEDFDDIIGFITKIRNSVCRLARFA